MSLVLTAAVLAGILANAVIAVADLARARFVLANSAEVGLPPGSVPWMAAPKIAGVLGLVAGLAGLAPVGLAAAIGLVLFYLGAVAAHLRARVLHNIAFPLAFLALAVAAAARFLV